VRWFSWPACRFPRDGQANRALDVPPARARWHLHAERIDLQRLGWGGEGACHTIGDHVAELRRLTP